MEFVTYFNVAIILLFVLIGMAIITLLRLKKRKNFVFLIFFTLFYIYIVKVFDYTLFQFQSLLVLKHFMPNLILQGQKAGENINIIPLLLLNREDLKTSLLNILLFIPFGFGLPFITHLGVKKIILLGALVSMGIEFLQLITGFLAQVTFRNKNMSSQKIAAGVVHQIPEDWRKVLSSKPKLLLAWNDLTPLGRNEWICWITAVKKEETRNHHIKRASEEIVEGKRRPCCWPGCPHREKTK